MMWESGCHAFSWNFRASSWYKQVSLVRWQHCLAFLGILWSPPFPAAKPSVVLWFAKFSGTELFHWDSLFFILSLDDDSNLAKSIFAIHVTLPNNPEFTVTGEMTSNFALPLWLTVEKIGLWVTQEHQGQGKQTRDIK